MNALAREVSSGNINSIFHIGDISYATGFLVEWDFFLHLISPLASQLSYMTAIGNHERYLHNRYMIRFRQGPENCQDQMFTKCKTVYSNIVKSADNLVLRLSF